MKIKNIDQLKANIQNLSLQTQQPSQTMTWQEVSSALIYWGNAL